MNDHNEAHQQGRQAARQLLAEYACPTCASSRTMPELPMVEMLVQCIGQNRSDACDYLTGWAEIVGPFVCGAVDTCDHELSEIDEAALEAGVTAAAQFIGEVSIQANRKGGVL